MLLMSVSFNEGAAIPGEFAFAAVDPKTQVALSQNRNPHLAWNADHRFRGVGVGRGSEAAT
jgi:hypothetical protein